MLISTYETIRNTLFMVVSLLVLFNVGKFDWFKGLNYVWLKVRFRSKYIFVCKYLKGFDEIYIRPTLCYLIATKKGLRVHPLYKIFRRDLYIPYQTIISFSIINNEYRTKGITDQIKLRKMNVISYFETIFLLDNTQEEDRLLLSLDDGESPHYRFNKYTLSKADFFENLYNYLPAEKITQRSSGPMD